MTAALRMAAALRMTVAALLLVGTARAHDGPSPAASPKTTPRAADELALRQQEIAGRYAHLEEVLLRMAELSAATDPHRAALLRKVVAQSQHRLIPVQFETLTQLLQKERLSRAIEDQEGLDRDLRALLELLLSENRSERLESEKARIRAYLKRLSRIIRRQQAIQGRTAGAADPKRLAGEQGDLADETRELARELKQHDQLQRGNQPQEDSPGPSRKRDQNERRTEAPPSQPGGSPAPQRLQAARQRMQEARQRLDEAQRAGAVEKQEEALRELDRVKRELEAILRQLREEEVARTLEVLEVRFRKMLDMQRAVYEGTIRLDKIPSAQRTHSHEIEASRLSNTESLIVLEADKALMLLRDDGTAVAFPEAVRQMREDMVQVVDRLARARVDEMTQSIEQDILAALEEMIEAVKRALADQEKARQTPPSAGQSPTGEPPLVDVLAELKMIRALQMRVNRRTQQYSTLIEGEQAESDELVEGLQRLAQREQRIYRITRDLEMGKNQ